MFLAQNTLWQKHMEKLFTGTKVQTAKSAWERYKSRRAQLKPNQTAVAVPSNLTEPEQFI